MEHMNAALLTTFLLTETFNRSKSIEINRVMVPVCPLNNFITAEMKWEPHSPRVAVYDCIL